MRIMDIAYVCHNLRAWDYVHLKLASGPLIELVRLRRHGWKVASGMARVGGVV